MGNITFIENNGEQHSVELESGKTLMDHAMNNSVPGVDADCGGECACGTCHVIVDEAFFEKTGSISDEEAQMLGMTPEKASSSRLSCQVSVTDEMDGMIVKIPEFQM